MRPAYWFVFGVLFVGLVLFVLGLYYMYVVREFHLGFELSVVGAVLWGVLLVIGIVYVAKVRVKILRDASQF